MQVCFDNVWSPNHLLRALARHRFGLLDAAVEVDVAVLPVLVHDDSAYRGLRRLATMFDGRGPACWVRDNNAATNSPPTLLLLLLLLLLI